jgi:hypothetical protein
MYWKIKHFVACLPLTCALMSVSACAVDLNDKPSGDDDTDTPECDAALRSRVRVLQAARTVTLMPPNKPTVPQTVSLNLPDPKDATKLVAFANLRFNATTSTTLCPGSRTVTVKSQTLEGDQIKSIDVGTFPIEIGEKKNYSLVVTGSITGVGEDGLHLISVDESAIPAAVGSEANVVLVNAIVDSPATLAVDTGGAEGPELAALPRFGTSGLVPVTIKDGEAEITLLDGDTPVASFTIVGFPTSNLLAVLYDKFAPAAMSTKTQAKLFLTGSDPLIGNAPGNGIKVSAN